MNSLGLTRAHVITGSFGSGKTTAIRWLMANKPEHELWMVILNEFTDAGLDALSVAESARGRYDVRLVAGGCLCCVGESTAFAIGGLTGSETHTAEYLELWRNILRDAANRR